jgi:Tol biopolymer transport system component
MKNLLLIPMGLLAVFVLAGCSISINQSTSITPTSLPEDQSSPSSTDKLPVSWSHLNLSGKLVFMSAEVAKNPSIRIQVLDLQSGDLSTIFQAPDKTWIYSLAVSPDGKELIMTYVPPSDGGNPSRQRLYIMPLDGSSPPQLLFNPPSVEDDYLQPDWSPDGKYIYFSHLSYQPVTTYEVMRMAYSNGQLDKVVDQAYWPRMASDGSRLTYVSIDPDTQANQLFVANPDGTEAQVVPLLGSVWMENSIIDAPMLLPDGERILFSAPIPLQSSSPNWVERLFGVTIASAHPSIPSDWWTVPLTGGEPTRLTHLYSPSLFATLSPDQKYIASYSTTHGVFVMNTEGQELTEIVSSTGGIPGTVSWIP